MAEITRALIARVGVDLSKRVYRVHAVGRGGPLVMAKALALERFFAWCAQLPNSCKVAMAACGGAHHVARRLAAMGLDGRLVAGQFVTPYRMAGKSGTNDANDAAAICEAAGRPHLRFVPVKTAQQQDQLVVHRLREGDKEERTGLINRIRGLLGEFGIAVAPSPEALSKALPERIEDAGNELTGIARLGLQHAHLHWIDIDLQITWCDERIAAHQRSDRISQWLVQLKDRMVWQKAVVALANKNARSVWAVLTRGLADDPDHVPIAPHERAVLDAATA